MTAAWRHRLDASRRAPLGPVPGAAALCEAEVLRLLPHRAPFRFVDRVLAADPASGLVVAEHDLMRSALLLRGHFPGDPVFPGVLQIEAIGQAAAILHALGAGPSAVGLVEVLGATFLRPVRPPGPLEVRAQVWRDGLYAAVVGQCLQGRQVCAVAALKLLFDEPEDPRSGP